MGRASGCGPGGGAEVAIRVHRGNRMVPNFSACRAVWVAVPVDPSLADRSRALPGFTERGDFTACCSQITRSSSGCCSSGFRRRGPCLTPIILAGSEPTADRIRLADALGWPSDFRTWRRFIDFLLRHVSAIPRQMRSLVLTNFDVWQNACAGTRNRTSSDILRQCEAWLSEFYDLRPSMWEYAPGLEDHHPSEFRASLVSLVLRSASSEPDAAERYLRGLLARPEITDTEFEEIVLFAPILSVTHPGLVADTTLAHLREELPEAQVEAERQREKAQWAAREAVRAKEPALRTEAENRFLAHPSFLHTRGVGFHDWQTLALDRGRNFFPASPLREPFASLFSKAPDQALRLVAELGKSRDHRVAATQPPGPGTRRDTAAGRTLTFPGENRFSGEAQGNTCGGEGSGDRLPCNARSWP